MESIHLSLHHLHARVYFLYWLGPLGLTDHQPNIYTSQPKYDFEWFCILMTCKQQWPRSSKLSTLHISTIFTHEEDLSAFKTLSLCISLLRYDRGHLVLLNRRCNMVPVLAGVRISHFTRSIAWHFCPLMIKFDNYYRRNSVATPHSFPFVSRFVLLISKLPLLNSFNYFHWPLVQSIMT